jgi:hypothetical protein
MLSTSIVDALKAQGHILVVKGGAASLARELDEIIAPPLAEIEPRLGPRGPLADEPTSTFGDDRVDLAVEEIVAKLARAMMSSDHVEDVFAEDAVIRRDIFRTMRDMLLAPTTPTAGERATVVVKLDTLGYVAATVSKEADAATLALALERAAVVAGAQLAAYAAGPREATFRIEGGGDDARLDVEEAVADELADLAELGVVPLPTVERRVALERELTPAGLRALRPRIDAAAEATLLGAGCAVTWEPADARTLRVIFTPLSERDGLGVDAPTAAFTREVAALIAEAMPTPKAELAPAPPPQESAEVAAPKTKRKAAAKSSPTRERASTLTPAPASKRASKAASKRAAESAAAEEPAPAPPKRKKAAASNGAAKAPASSARGAKSRGTKAGKAPTKKG